MPLSQYNPENYAALLAEKTEHTQQLFTDIYTGEWDVYPSPPSHFRMRAEFRIWHNAEDIFYAMFRQDDPKTPHRIDQFPIANERINDLMPRLLDAIRPINILRHKLFQVEFLTASDGDCVISLIYHKAIDDNWQEAAAILKNQLGVDIIGRSRKQKRVLGKDFVIEKLTINGQDYRYQQIENSFTQPNANVCENMVGWACNHSQCSRGDLLELYCGNGNFTLPLSRQYSKVLATEISKTSVRSALYNAEINNIDNLTLLRMSSEELTQALNGEREFRRLEGVSLSEYQLQTLFVDPPRAGLDENTCALASGFEKIIYISCNPLSLARDLAVLHQTHKVMKMALFDQFPYTHHAECGAILTRR